MYIEKNVSGMNIHRIFNYVHGEIRAKDGSCILYYNKFERKKRKKEKW